MRRRSPFPEGVRGLGYQGHTDERLHSGGAPTIRATISNIAMRFSVRHAYAVQYPDPITLSAGAEVTVVRRDDEFTHWVWCRAIDGREGWVPETILSSTTPGPATVSESYSARELPLEAAEVVDVLTQFDGFALGRRDDGQIGWFPLSVLDQSRVMPGAS